MAILIILLSTVAFLIIRWLVSICGYLHRTGDDNLIKNLGKYQAGYFKLI